eukprot:TRINITY_DN5950_c1_g4_i1.p2 TRINITY_DN5950_c1_g4~~TRINITY_DN5950_c1_g4_i1.p2  ORF type:complete len:309 (-),score=70.95 TRINITY_DN5950_c1_g4_i1:699-1625(-)
MAAQPCAVDPAVFDELSLSAAPPRLVVFDFDETLTLQTRNSTINDYVSGWKGQIDPWRVLNTEPGAGWDFHDDAFAADGVTSTELREEFSRGKHTTEAYMQQAMQNFIRESFNDTLREGTAMRSADFLEQEVRDPGKRLYHLRKLLGTIRDTLDAQDPKGKLVVMTYNAWSAIFVLNVLIHADMSQYFDAVHNQINAVVKTSIAPEAWKLVGDTEVSVFDNDLGRIQVQSEGRILTGKYGKAEAVEEYYRDCGGLAHALLIDDDANTVSAWDERGGRYSIDLSRIIGEYKLTTEYIKHFELRFLPLKG